MIHDLLQALSTDEVSTRSHERGELVFRQSAKTAGMFVLVSGAVQLRRVTEAGDTVVVHTPSSGESFAEPSVFSEHYHCDAMCTRPSTVIRINKDAVLGHLRSDPEFAVLFSRMMAGQVQGYRQRLEITAIRSAKDRVAMALSVGLLKGTVVEFAGKIGLTHEATYRALRSLVNEGRVANPSRGIYEPR